MLGFLVILVAVALVVAINIAAWLWMPVNIASAQTLGWPDHWPAMAINGVFAVTLLVWLIKRRFEHRLFYAGWVLCGSGLVGIVPSIEHVLLRWKEGLPELDLRFSDGLSICSAIVGAILMIADSAFAFASARQPKLDPKEEAGGAILPGVSLKDIWHGLKATRVKSLSVALALVGLIGVFLAGAAAFADAGTSQSAEVVVVGATPSNYPSIRGFKGLRYSSREWKVLSDGERPVWHNDSEDAGRDLFPRTYAWHFVDGGEAAYEVVFAVTKAGVVEKLWIDVLRVENELIFLPAERMQILVKNKSGRVIQEVSLQAIAEQSELESFSWAGDNDGLVARWRFDFGPIILLEGQTMHVIVFPPPSTNKGIVALGEVAVSQPKLE